MQLIAGEWWNANVVDVENEGLATGAAPNSSDAYTINGLPGDFYNCSQNRTYPIARILFVCVDYGQHFSPSVHQKELTNMLCLF